MSTLSRDDAFHYRVKKVKGHKCNLNMESDTVSSYIHSGLFIPFRRYLRKSIMISTRDPRANAYAKSLSRIIIEERRHLERYFFIIHPFSDFNFLWQSIMTIVHLIILTVIPVFYLDNPIGANENYNYALSITLSSICIINIGLSFFIGYYETTEEKVILRPKRIIRKYLTTHFIFDLISSLNYNVFGSITYLFQPNWFSRFQWGLKIIRLFTINDYMDNVQLRLGVPNYIFRTTKYFTFTVVLLLWFNFSLYALDIYYERKIQDLDLLNKFFLAANKNLQTFYQCTIFKNYYEKIYNLDLYLSIAFLHLGKFFEIWFLAQIFHIFASYMIITQKYQTMIYQVEAFTRFKDLPKRICRRIYSYLNFRCQCLVFNEKDLIDNVCLTLRDEILWNKCQNLVTKVQTFAELPTSIKLKLATMLKPEIYLPNDVVIHTGEVGSEMFFVYVGVLAVFTESGKEICHLSDGSHFGEIALLLNETRVASVVAIDFCELYRLTKKDFHEAIEPYPLVKENILKAAQDRFQQTRIISQQ
ncbi:hypothetical protein WA026_000455 [Henosepilachna vigintioctopunctata]|uniref:Cyclic nucleotide-binding domain-containing protein n=1 Tax=Henosepilachna vigintioctopunctata TaxID=420089 RepID=A0AAW1V576_9CUCU